VLSSCRPKDIDESGVVEGLTQETFEHEEVKGAWSPFTDSLEDSDVCQNNFSSSRLEKLDAAGFSNVLDVRLVILTD
jgi:hypothetical protein